MSEEPPAGGKRTAPPPRDGNATPEVGLVLESGERVDFKLEDPADLAAKLAQGGEQVAATYDDLKERTQHELRVLEWIAVTILIVFGIAVALYGILALVRVMGYAEAGPAAADLLEAIKVVVMPILTLILGYYTGARKK